MAKSPRYNRRSSSRSAWGRLAPVLPLGALLAAWIVWSDPQMRDDIGIPMEAGVAVEQRFALCEERGYSSHCVVDGDTFRIGDRRIRIEGIDAPERQGRCPAETELARRATTDLQEWLNRGRFAMLAQDDVPRDVYGRELQAPWREDADGARHDLGEHMIAIGSADIYRRGDRTDWC